MQYVVCYDVADDARRSRLVSALLDFGARIEESVFTADLDEELAGRMLARIEKAIDPMMDRVHVFELCEACRARTHVIGTAELAIDREFYVI